MKPRFDLCILRPLSRRTPLSGLPPNVSISSITPPAPRFFEFRRSTARLALIGLGLAGVRAVAQQPSLIPNWPADEPGTTASQYSPNAQYGQPQYQQPPAYGQQQPGYPQQQSYNDPTQGFAQPYQPAQALSPDRLEQMVAPVALYPDNLVSMVLAASTYPAQVAAADQWLHMQGGAPPEQIAAGANAQTTWDPSIKALTAFPQVIGQMAQNLQWTTDLGNAYYNQPQDVMQTIQVMRDRAQAAGNLQSTPQQEVIQDQGNIEIAPPTPQVVYVPQYNPWESYGQPVDPYPGFNALGAIGSFIGNALLQFGPGIAMNAFSATPFGWLGWGLDWLSHAIFFGGDLWNTHSGSVRDWGFAHGGGRYWGAHGELAGYRGRGGWGGRGGWEHNTFRSGLDRGNFPHATSPTPRAFNGGQRAYGNQGNFGNRGGEYGRGFQGNGNTYGRGNGYQSSGNTFGQRYGQNGSTYGRSNGYGQNGSAYGRNNSYGQSGNAYGEGNRIPQATGRPQQYGSAREYAQGGYGGARQSNGYASGGRESYGSSGLYSHPLQNYGMRPGFGGSNTQAYRSPSYSAGSGNRSYGYNGGYAGSSRAYGGSSNFGGSNIARTPSGGGFHPFGGGHGSSAYSYGGSGGGYKAPKAPSYGGGGHSFFGGGGGGYKAPKAPHFSGGGHFGGGGSHFGGGGHSSGGHSGGGHSGGGHSSKHH
ncbi:MAG TPA: DUF3300 domain-containing protein [Terracidiphilus sp.]|nr:DUF3300 domain-containing protein [Terracidiphilus sp.]